MSSGKRYKWQGSVIQVMTSYTGGSPLTDITAATNANPCVLTVGSGHGIVAGDAFRIADIVGMTELNDDLFIAAEVNTNAITLFGVDSSGYGTYVSGGTIDEAVLSTFCELTNWNRQGGSSPEIPSTSICSVNAEFEVGLPDFGTTALSYNFAPLTSTVQGALHDYWQSGEKIVVKVTLPRNGGIMVQEGFVQQESETAGNGGLWTATATLRNTGGRLDLAAS